MISAVSPTTFLSASSVSMPTERSMSGESALKYQASVPVVDTSKFQPDTKSQSNSSTSSSKSSNDVAQNQQTQPSESTAQSSTELSVEAKQVIDQLKARDAEVRAHEQAHLSAAGGYATGGASYAYQVGPDGRRYAIGGEVGIDVSPVAGDPEATLLKASVVQRAALAPAEPSTQDMRVASAAMQMANQARMEIASQVPEDSERSSESNSGGDEMRNGDQAGEQPETIQANTASQDSPFLFDRNGFDLRMQLQPMA